MILFGYQTKRGAHVIETIKPKDLETRTKKAFARRINAEAWQEDNREAIVAEVFKRDGRWIWWCETELEPTTK